MRKSSRSSTTCRRVKSTTAGVSPFSFVPSTACDLNEELRYLRIRGGKDVSELWTIYQKSMGGTKAAKTEPRRLHPLLVRDADGSAINWNLQSRLQVGEKLPPLNSEGKGSEALSRYLRRREVWLSMLEDAKKRG